MTTQEYIDNFKNRFGNQSSKDGQLIRDMNDFEVLDRALKRYPGDREEIDEVDLDMYYQTYDPSKKPPPPPPKTGVQKKIDELTGGIKTAFETRRKAQEEALGKSIDGEQGIASGFLQAAGQGAGFIGDVGFEAIKAVTPEPVQEAVGGAVEAVAGTAPVQGAMEAYSGFKEENPELAGNIEAVGNIASVIPGVGVAGKGAQLGAKAAKEGVETVVDAAKTGLNTAGNIVDARTVAKTADQAKKQFDETIEITSPVLDKKGKIGAIERAGQPGGLTERGRMGTYTVAPDAKAIEIAEDTYGLVSKKQGPIENVVNLNKEIGRVSEDELAPFLRESGQVYNPMQLETFLKQVPKPLSLKANAESARAYDLVVQTALNIAKKHPPTSEGLWKARAEIDDMIEREFGDVAFDSPSGTGSRKAALIVRNGINDFIGESVGGADLDIVNKVNAFIREARKRGIEINDPMEVRKQMNAAEGAQNKIPLEVPDAEFNKAFWKAKLKQLSNMYTARENIAEQNWKLMDKNAFERWMKQNPGKAALAKQGLGIVGLGALGAAGATLLSE